MPLKKGKTIPAFSVVNQNNEIVTHETILGKPAVLFFYPKDNTPTCTEEVCNIRDNYKRLIAEGYKVYGISPDSVKKHQNFIKKYKLPFDLLSDPDLRMLKSFKVWAKKKLFGHEYMGVLRTTYITDEAGKITEVIEKVISKNHTAQILEKYH